MIEQKFIRNPYPFNWSTVGSKMTNVLCSDGKTRTFTATSENDTVWTTPGRVKVNGKTVTGHLWHDSLYESEDFPNGVWKFTAYSYRKNGKLLPPWK